MKLFVHLLVLLSAVFAAEMNEDVQGALDAAQAGDWTKAKAHANKAIAETEDTDPIPHQVLSQILLMQGEHKESLKEATKAAMLAPAGDTKYYSQKTFHEGIVAQDEGNYKLALSQFKRSIDLLDPKQVDAKSLELVALATAALGDIPTAVRYLKQLWRERPMFAFHNSIPFVRIVDLYEEQMEHARMKGTDNELKQRLSNITTVTDVIYLDVSIGSAAPERIEIGLYGRACPKAVENMKGMAGCTSQNKQHCYKGSGFHRIIKDFIIQGGDISPGDGTGRVNIFNRPFGDEVYAMALMHDGPGVVQMANSGPDSNGGQFVIMVQGAAHLNGNHVVVGKVLKGLKHVVKINAVEVDGEKYSPNTKVTIQGCGVLVNSATAEGVPAQSS